MALEDLTPFGTAPSYYQGLLGADETAALQKRAQVQGLLGAGLALAQGMSRSGAPRSALQNILGAGVAGFQGAGGAYQQGLQNFQTEQQIQKYKLDLETSQRNKALVNNILQDPTIPEEMKAYIASNPSEGLKMYAEQGGLARARAGIPAAMPQQQPAEIQTNIQPQQNVQQEQNLQLYGDGGEFPQNAIVNQYTQARQPVLQPVQQPTQQVSQQVTQPVQDQFASQINQLKADISYWQQRGNYDQEKKARENLDMVLRDQRQQQLPVVLDKALVGVNPALQKEVDFVKSNAPYFTQEQLDKKVTEILTKNRELQTSQSDYTNEVTRQAAILFPNKPLNQLSQKELAIVDQALQNKALARATASAPKPEDIVFKRSMELRKEYNGMKIIQDFDQIKTAQSQITTALSRPSPANDLVASTKFMKLLDPGSVVRESELNMSMNATGLVDKVRNYAQSVINGQKLNDVQRADFRKSTEELYKAAESRVTPIQQRFIKYAEQGGVNPNLVVTSETQDAVAAEIARRRRGN